jgi:hypothetical protein
MQGLIQRGGTATVPRRALKVIEVDLQTNLNILLHNVVRTCRIHIQRDNLIFLLSLLGGCTAGPEGMRRVRSHWAPKTKGPSSHWTLALFFSKYIYPRHKYVRVMHYRSVSFRLLN